MRFATTAVALAAAVAAATLLLGATAHAAPSDHREREHGRGERREGAVPGRAPADPAAEALYRKECGACHVAYPAHLLPAEGWRRILGGLERHFGQNAELDAATRDALGRHLAAGAGRDTGGDPTRVTDAPWFRREHRKAARQAGTRAVPSLAHCAACHPGAEAGDFDEHRVRIPRD